MEKIQKLKGGVGAVALAALVVLLALPVVLTLIVGHDAGLLVSIFLLLVVNPFFFAFVGMYGAKKNLETGCKGIALSALAFVLGASLGLQMSVDFVVKYTAAYCGIGCAAICVTMLVLLVKRKKKKQ